jgi:predicted glycoside hydrolase/deacetylase ChbG (UPF0249 family)
MALKKLILCADDFGQNAKISEGILELAQSGRLSAVSCMVNGSDWPDDIEALKNCDVQIGLHLNFTHGQPLTFACQMALGKNFPSLASLLLYQLGIKKIDQAIIYQEIEAQILKFKDDVGFYPHFIDGHQHVHQLPFISEVLIEVVEGLDFYPWFRTTYTDKNKHWTHFFNWKRWVLYFLGGKQFANHLHEKQYMCNADFSGDYTFRAKANYPKRFKNFLANLDNEGLIMCHPGKNSRDESDAIANIRPIELAYLQSDDFLKDLAQYGFILGQLH